MPNSALCILKYAYDVNVALHLLLVNTVRDCSFITLSVVIKRYELTLPFVPQTVFSALSAKSVSSCGFNVFMFARGKQQINVPDMGKISNLQKIPSETPSASCLLHAVCWDSGRWLNSEKDDPRSVESRIGEIK